MGFTPWPWDATVEAVDWTYAHLQTDGDLISQHIEEGVPWQEALDGTPFASGFQSSLQDRRNRTAPGQKVVLQLNPLDMGRAALAPFRNNGINVPLTAPWSGYAFNHPDVKTAYVNYVRRVTDLLLPDFVQTGVEVNILRRNSTPQVWAQYVELQCHTYQALKAAGYTQPIGVSLVTQALYHPDIYATEYNEAQQIAALRDLEPCVDVIAWSVHPFISGLLADTWPADYLTLISALTTKPQAIPESSYPAQVWSLNTVTWNGTPQKQTAFTTSMLDHAGAHGFLYVVWFAIRDYDQLWQRPPPLGLGQDSLSLIWRDTGLYDESGVPRAAHAVWMGWRNR